MFVLYTVRLLFQMKIMTFYVVLFSYSQVISTSLPFFLVTAKISEEMDRGSSVEHGIGISVLYICT